MLANQARTISSRDDHQLLSSELLDVRIHQFYVLLKNRNAWHSTTSRRYDGAEGLFTTSADAKHAAEALRSRGSWFTVLSVPAISLVAELGAMGLADHHALNSFGKWDREKGGAFLRVGTPLKQTLAAFEVDGLWRSRVNEHSLIAGTLERVTAHDLLEQDPAWVSWDSYSHGSGYYMGWTERQNHYDTSAVESIRYQFESVNGLQLTGLSG
ncbi:hypothetical protein [Aeromicrobium duanguangcaii]|uniref:Uncharacterized protein n=1 Tax=Aeromicrobium duanguangcaii TaxID=2968086 RepID=A0ABY5KKH6_9ACTN|nr:hypothetical protein [Aeromicrobium duanguangcaii]MCD9152938.1 hypothetical protein [Aeromicrobium duanguangcaii]UUI69956.1 hypothetical protein NP095_07635 [Aeromicrobium duanguangcaii]